MIHCRTTNNISSILTPSPYRFIDKHLSGHLFRETNLDIHYQTCVFLPFRVCLFLGSSTINRPSPYPPSSSIKRMILAPLIPMLFLLQLATAAFVETFPINVYNPSALQFKPFVIYVALDTKRQLLKFFINTKIYSHLLNDSTDAVITDVDSLTNRYTTLHVDIDFMGKKFVLENLRLCEIIAVKNTSLYENTPRFTPIIRNDTSANRSDYLLPTSLPYYYPNGTRINTSLKKRAPPKVSVSTNSTCYSCGPEVDTFLATSNTSIANYFSNSTGHLLQCPLYQNDSIVLYYQADVSDFSRRIGSYTAKFTIVSNGVDPTIIGGARCYVTPIVQPKSIESLIFFFVLALLLIANGLNFFIMAFSPDQESSNPFLIEASTICNKRLLEQLEASTDRIISYLQFALFMGGLNIQYPGFYQPLIGQIRWCSLLGVNLLNKNYSIPSPQSDNAYITLNFSGLKSLSLYSSNGFIHYSWQNFMVCLIIWMAISMLIYQCYIALKLTHLKQKFKVKASKLLRLKKGAKFGDKDLDKDFHSNYSVTRNAWALVGHCLRVFLSTFGFVFLLLTIFMLYSAGTFSTLGFTEEQVILRLNAFDPTFPYDSLIPNQPPNRSLYVISAKNVAGGVVSILLWCGLATFFVSYYLLPIRNWRIRPSANVSRLYTSVKTIITWAYLYSTYKPGRVHYVLVDLLGVVSALIVVGALQSSGTVQVVLMIVIEFLQLVMLLVLKPHFLKMTWHSLSWIMRSARLLVALLCIAYIRQLGISESSRTYVAYAQLIIHILVVAIYVAHLIYCSSLVLRALFKKRRSTQLYANKNSSAPESLDNLLVNVEMKNVKPIAPSHWKADGFDNTASLIANADDEEVDYYRSHTGNMFLNMNATLSQVDILNKNEYTMESVFADRPTPSTHDYTTREADRIYQIGLSNPNIDPEIRKMWEARERTQSCEQVNPSPVKTTSSFELRSLFHRKKEPTETGFQVSRPRPLVVKQNIPSDPDE